MVWSRIGNRERHLPFPEEGLDLDFEAAGHLYATHGLHAFAAKCPPPLVRWAVERFSEPGDRVLDPMCGSGTTLVEATLRGRVPLGIDIDPLARLVSATKATLIDPEAIRSAADALTARLVDGTIDSSWRPDLPDLEVWFRQDVVDALARLRIVIGEHDGGADVCRLLWTVFSSLIVARTSVANARDLVHSRHHFRAWEESPDVQSRFAAQLRRATRLMEDFRDRMVGSGYAVPQVQIVGTDARRIPLSDDSIELVFTSPPYCSALDYTRAHIFSVAWMADVLGMTTSEYRMLGRSYVGSERAPMAEASPERQLPPPSGHIDVDAIVASLAHHPKRAWIVFRYFRDMATVLSECGRVLRPGGHAVLVVCPSNIRTVRIPTHELFAAIASPASGGALELVGLHQRTIHDHRRVMPYLATSFGERMRTEFVLVLRKQGG